MIAFCAVTVWHVTPDGELKRTGGVRTGGGARMISHKHIRASSTSHEMRDKSQILTVLPGAVDMNAGPLSPGLFSSAAASLALLRRPRVP